MLVRAVEREILWLAVCVCFFCTDGGVCLQVSELEGHEGDVTAVVVAPPPVAAAAKLASYCWTAGLDGFLIYWDFAAAELVRKVQVGLPVHSMVSRFANFAALVATVLL